MMLEVEPPQQEPPEPPAKKRKTLQLETMQGPGFGGRHDCKRAHDAPRENLDADGQVVFPAHALSLVNGMHERRGAGETTRRATPDRCSNPVL